MMRCDMLENLLESVKENLYYRDGVLYWKKTQGRKIAHRAAGCLSKGYVLVGLEGKLRPAHRLIYLLHHGHCPQFLDHIDGNRSNNKLENLRPATANENARNCKIPTHNTSGHKGVCWDAGRNKWMAYITINNKFKSLGRFEKIEDASEAYKKAAVRFFGEFARI